MATDILPAHNVPRGVGRLRSAFVLLALIGVALSLGAQPALFHDHGHGLSFSSDGKTLLAPGQVGLAVYQDGVWSEAPGPEFAFSGFSVTEDAIYSSGRSPSAAMPSKPLGLVKSTDGGATWQRLALGGEADFPLLAAGYRSRAVYVLNTWPHPAMPAPGIYVTQDEGKSWRRAAARRLEGTIHALAAHPRQAGTVSVATEHGIYISRDAGESFLRLDVRELATGVAFDPEGRRLLYTHALSNEVVETALESQKRRALRLPPLAGDYVTCLAQSPKDEGVLAFATRRRNVYLTYDGGLTWQLVARGEDLERSPAMEGER